MPTLTIRNIEPETHAAIRQEAAKHNQSMEDEIRQLISQRYRLPKRTPLEIAQSVHAKLQGYPELVEFLEREQSPLPDPISFDE